MSNILETLDAGLTGLFGQWNGYSTGLVTVLVVVLGYQILRAADPDVHPILLARQSTPSAVRKEGESAVYRSPLAPHGMPLNSGLNVKPAGASKWARGHDGDLRDIWRKVVQGGNAGAKGKLLTVHGSQNVQEHNLDDVTRQINLIGQHITEQGGIRVAIYLPNSMELLAALFACAFSENLTAVLIPFDVPEERLVSMLRRAAVDTVITATGEFPLDAVVKAYPGLRQLIWVVDRGSAHMDWNEVPEGIGGSVSVATWQDIVRDAAADAGRELPAAPAADSEATSAVGDVVTFWQSGKPNDQQQEMVRFTQANLIAGVAGQLAAIPTKARLTNADLFLPASALTGAHALVLTLAALYSNASVALNSAAGARAIDLTVATQGIAPTVVVADSAALLQTRARAMAKLPSPLGTLAHALSRRTLVNEGIMAGANNALSAFASAARPVLGNAPGALRLVYTTDRAGSQQTPGLSPAALTDLRVLTGARVVYALAAAKVAGAVAQTAVYDYRAEVGDEKGHFGAPTSSVEVVLKDSGSYKTTDDQAAGEIYVKGPCVSGGEAGLGVMGVIRDDHTLALA
ncbi:AMP-dependent synthetase/ligase [Cordyceps fumosorosea ARSEF 2679]|uniref:AMP-dependent synthetase/ligase n=1 Tax=Cordyceps fumosorosea (strain ARSEF 2679) TaxID=1081104 RepID=A0A167ZLJ6_CORFA|nr:AMP-dependent synthetase/ligase [Cordyceps fumosorosea ARSEF 2679]OAA67660.1 AMP-dependent synthetase/ligase [Cordyceps fumosorosea ARSEF 2679]